MAATIMVIISSIRVKPRRFMSGSSRGEQRR
jgi:hypothetical protein